MTNQTHGGSGATFGDEKGFFNNLLDFIKKPYFTDSSGNVVDTTIGDLVKGPVIEWEDTDSDPTTWNPSLIYYDPFKAGTVVEFDTNKEGELVIVNETDASKTQIIGGDPAPSFGVSNLDDILLIGGLTLVVGLILGLILD